MKILQLMKYDALNIADGELGLGLQFFEKIKQNSKIPLLSSNIYKNNQPLGQLFVIKQFPGFKAGIVGIVSPNYFNQEFLKKEGLEIKDPAIALKEILPRVKAQANLIILLSHLGKLHTSQLVQNIPGIDIAIVGHDLGNLSPPQKIGNTILVQSCMQGKFLGILDLTLRNNAGIAEYNGNIIAITEETPSDPKILKIIEELSKRKKSPNLYHTFPQ
ncbi:MAG: hypothetical protein N3A64_00385 [Desulfobacterota bacterium]|nr:hypothetical protein [Thermodesulfobacteriota bacterium]